MTRRGRSLVAIARGNFPEPEPPQPSRPVSLVSIARALAVSPLWSEMPPSTLLVRREPEPALAVLGEFDEAEVARLAGLRRGLEEHLTRLRYVPYSQAEAACEELAGRLVQRFGREYLRSLSFVAIPRGGLFVLGMLSYLLGLDHERLEAPERAAAGRPIVVVDDCAYTGHRFGRYLERLRWRQSIFAHLYSHPDLRAAIEREEQSVVALVAARDLHDYAPADHGDKYEEWRERARAVGPRPSYWIGRTERVCFAWSEPDYNFWNPVTGRLESGWSLAGPDLCLKNREGAGRTAISLEVQPPARGDLRPPPGVLFGEFEGTLIVGNLDTGESIALDPVAAEMWRALVECESRAEALARLAAGFDADSAKLEADLSAFAADLMARGMLQSAVT